MLDIFRYFPIRTKSFFLLFLFLIYNTTTAQNIQKNFNLSGMVVDSLSGNGLADVNVIVLSRIDSTVIIGITTDRDGNFTAENITQANVRIKFSMVGYQTKTIDSVSVNTTSNIGFVRLRATTIMLPEVVIKTFVPMIESHIDKQVVNLAQVPGSTGSITDALKNSGAVDVDQLTSKITVRGEDVKIQMDGHPFDMPDNMLAQMPASMFDQVEIILSPSAKESAEGGAYILNLISKKNILDSYNGSISLNSSTNNKNYGGLNFNYKKDKLNIFSSLFGNLGKYKSFEESEQINYNSSSLYHQLTNGEGNSKGYGGYFKLGFDYNFDEENLFTFYGAFNKFKYNGDGISNNSVLNNSGLFLYNFNNQYHSVYNFNSFSLYSFYKKKFDKEVQELTFDALFTNISSPSNSELNTLYNNGNGLPLMHSSDTDEKANTFISKIEYIHPAEIVEI